MQNARTHRHSSKRYTYTDFGWQALLQKELVQHAGGKNTAIIAATTSGLIHFILLLTARVTLLSAAATSTCRSRLTLPMFDITLTTP